MLKNWRRFVLFADDCLRWTHNAYAICDPLSASGYFVRFVGSPCSRLSFAASLTNAVNADLLMSVTLASLTCFMRSPSPCSNPFGSRSSAPRQKPNVTWFFDGLMYANGPLNSKMGCAHFTASVDFGAVLRMIARNSATMAACPAFNFCATYSSTDVPLSALTLGTERGWVGMGPP